jgi:hypothetical protein
MLWSMGSTLNSGTSLERDAKLSRIGMVLERHEDYTGKIIVSIKGETTYFWDTSSFRQKNPLPCGRAASHDVT